MIYFFNFISVFGGFVIMEIYKWIVEDFKCLCNWDEDFNIFLWNDINEMFWFR